MALEVALKRAAFQDILVFDAISWNRLKHV